MVVSGCRKDPKFVRPEPLTIEGVPVPGGQIMIFNDPGEYFTFLFPGKTFHNLAGGGRPITLKIDSLTIQMTSVAVSTILPSGSALLTEPEILARHQAWETEFLASQATSDQLGLYREHVTLPNGRGCLVWTIDTPGHPTHMLVSSVVGPRVLVLSGLLEKISSGDMVDLLLAAIGTIRRHNHPIDAKWIRDSLSAKR